MIDYKTKNLLKALLKQKYISKEEYHKAYKTLEKCKEKDKEFYYTNKAKFLITQKRYEEAKRILLQIEQEENKPSFYYSLYKISIYETNNKDFDNNNFNEELEKKIRVSFNKTLS